MMSQINEAKSRSRLGTISSSVAKSTSAQIPRNPTLLSPPRTMSDEQHAAPPAVAQNEEPQDEARRKALEIAQKLNAMRGGA
jgi:hypothetical protein